MCQITSENTFETAIVESLMKNGGYTKGNALDYSPEIGMYKYEKILEDKAFGSLVKEWMLKKVYTKLNEKVANS